MDRHSGRQLSGAAHLAQSIHDILTTPKGSLVMQRSYGSDLPNIIDQPLNGETMIDAYMATAEALDLWEPRIELARIELVNTGAGYAEFALTDADGLEISMPLSLDTEGATQ
ncbi:GPW/gp25 family protein [Parasedimentitalea marina]|nr:GPW/gp25 family protein [Parasedimentitalea marina]